MPVISTSAFKTDNIVAPTPNQSPAVTDQVISRMLESSLGDVVDNLNQAMEEYKQEMTETRVDITAEFLSQWSEDVLTRVNDKCDAAKTYVLDNVTPLKSMYDNQRLLIDECANLTRMLLTKHNAMVHQLDEFRVENSLLREQVFNKVDGLIEQVSMKVNEINMTSQQSATQETSSRITELAKPKLIRQPRQPSAK